VSAAELIAAAAAVRARAYVPYSGYAVGAAIRGAAGGIFAGCNVENAAYPQGACAETGAISAMVLAGGRRIAAILVIGDGDRLCTPCGGCRQRIREFAGHDTPVHIAGPEGLRRSFTLDALLPFSFGPDHLA
jgi:cytidine deaminase